MSKSIRTTLSFLAISLLGFNSASSIAQDSAVPPNAAFKVLTADEIQKLHGEKPVQVGATRQRGKFRYDLSPDGSVTGFNESLVGSAAAAAGSSSGKWLVKNEAQKICYEWSHARWQNFCGMVIQYEDGSYAWSSDGKEPGQKFTVTPR